MALFPSAIVTYLTASALSSLPGPALPHYAYCIDLAAVFRWALGSTLTPDGRMVLAASGGLGGNWIRVRADDAGADLVDGDETLTVGQGAWRTMSVATLTANATKTLSTVNAVAGDTIEVTRLDATGYDLALVNGGAAAGTLMTMIARTCATAQFNGTNWRFRRSSHLY